MTSQSNDRFFVTIVEVLQTGHDTECRLINLSTDVKLALFRSYCTCFYCPFVWTHYKKSTHSKLRVAFNNVYHRILKLPPRSSASTMYAVNHIESFEILVRKRVVGFTERLKVSENLIISCIDNSWKMQFEM